MPDLGLHVGDLGSGTQLEIYAIVLKRRERRQFAAAFDALMQDAIPSMQQARMQDVGRPTPDSAATRNTGIAA